MFILVMGLNEVCLAFEKELMLHELRHSFLFQLEIFMI